VKLYISPISTGNFPWLSGIATSYAYYRWRRLRVCYSSTCPTTTSGDVALGLFYDVEDVDAWYAGTNHFSGLSQTQNSVSGPFWGSTLTNNQKGQSVSEIMLDADILRTRMRTQYSLVSVPSPDTADQNQAIALHLGIVIGQSGSAGNVGRLFFDYEIELVHPTQRQSAITLLSSQPEKFRFSKSLEPAFNPIHPTEDPLPDPPES